MGCEQRWRTGPAADVIGLRFERIDWKSIVFGVGFFTGGCGANGMRVIVDGFDTGDLGGDLRIDSK